MTIDKDEAIRLLRKEVANKGPDYVYERLNSRFSSRSCVYFDEVTGEPSCIVGHVLADTEHVQDIATNLNIVGVAHIAEVFPDLMTREATQIFEVAQDFQDRQHPWGQSLEAAEKKYRELGGTE